MTRNRLLWLLPLAFMAIVAALILGAATYLLSFSLQPDTTERDNQTLQWLRHDYPGTVEWMDSMTARGALRDTFIVNPHGIRLHAYYAPCDSACGTVLLAHGYTDEARRMMMLGRLYHDSLRFNILLPDHERHGQSGGEEIQMGWHDRLNLQQWIHVTDSLWPHTPTFLHGISMGGATVLMCSGDSLPPSVRGVIDDCGYTSVWDEFSGEIHNQFGLPVHPLMDVASWLCQLRYGWNFKEASALRQVRRSTLPILFIHGTADTYVPTAMVHQLYAAKTHGSRTLWLAPGSAHAMSFHDHPHEYLRQLRLFIAGCE